MPKVHMLRAAWSVALGMSVLLSTSVVPAQTSTKELMKARHDHYHKLGEAFKTVRDEARAGTPDMSAIQRAAKVVSDASINQGRWFAAGTGPEAGKTRALPEIWQRPEDFVAAQKVFSDIAPTLVAAANAGDIGAVKKQFGEVGRACKNCHDTFRSPEEHD
jgi:cytochrome c556